MPFVLHRETTARRLNMTTKSSKFANGTNQTHAHVNTHNKKAYVFYIRKTYTI